MSSKSMSKEQMQWLQRRRELWHIEQEQEKLHERRKSQKIEEFERKRAWILNINKTQKSPQREQEIISIENKFSENLEDSTTTINKKDLHSIKIEILHADRTIFRNRANQNVSEAFNTSIITIDDIIIPRRPDEGSHPIFNREEIKKGWTELKKVDIIEKDNKPTVMQNTKSDNQWRTSMSADRKNADSCKRDGETVHDYRLLHSFYLKFITMCLQRNNEE